MSRTGSSGDETRKKTVILVSNDLSHPSHPEQQYAFSWRINRLRPLLKRGYEVVVVTAGGRVGPRGRPILSGLKPTVKREGGIVVISPPILRIPMLWLFQSMILTPLAVLLYCRGRKVEVEAIVAASVPYGAVAKVLNRFLKTVLIVDYGDPDYARESSLSLRVLNFFERWVLDPKDVDAVTCIDPNIGRYVSRYRVRSTFLPPGGYWKTPVDPEGRRAQAMGTTKTRQSVIYAGHIAPPPAYRLDLLVEAAPRIMEAMPETSILFLGDGEYLPRLRKRSVELGLEGKVLFEGAVPYETAKEEIAKADVAVQLLNDMCLGTKVMDYFSAGRAVVSSGTFYDSYDEFLVNGENCILVPPDPARLAEAVIRLLSSKELRDRLGRNALETVEGYDWDSQTEKLLTLIAEGRAKRNGRP